LGSLLACVSSNVHLNEKSYRPVSPV
jgi:hypothetical protein